jgi:PP-loop superfamily ATP-utilizing enzyme
MPLKITEQVQVLVEHTDPDGTTFRDAIYVTQQQRAVLTDADLVVDGQRACDLVEGEPGSREEREAGGTNGGTKAGAG